MTFRRALRQLLADENGSTAIEYAFIITGIFLAIVTAVYGLSDEVNNMFNNIANTVSNNM